MSTKHWHSGIYLNIYYSSAQIMYILRGIRILTHYIVLDTVLSSLFVVLILEALCDGWYYYSHCTNEKTEVEVM